MPTKISLNVAKTEVIIFRRKKYLGLYLNEYLDWSPHINYLSCKLVKANAMLCKLHCYVNEATIKSIYYASFYSHLSWI